MWVAIRKIAGKEGREYLPGDAVPEATTWRNPRIWTRWIKDVPDAEVVNGRWTRYEEVMLRGAKPAAKPATPPAQPVQPTPPPAPPAAPVEPALEPAAAEPAAAQSADPAEAVEDEKPKRRRRSAFLG